MSSSESGSISKLIIKAYSDEKFSSQKGEFTAAINPEDLKITGGINYNVARSMGTAGGSLKYNSSAPRAMHFTLYFDETGIFQGQKENVMDQVEQLKKVVYEFQEDIHSPYYVRIIWGVVDFKGRLDNLELRYTMFEPSGKPIRAQAEVSIIEVNETIASSQKQTASQSKSDAGAASDTATKTEKDDQEADQNKDATAEDGEKTSDYEEGPQDSASTASTAGAADAGESVATDGTVHEVQEGETLSGIADQQLGDPNLAPDLAALNGLDSLSGLSLPTGLPFSIPFNPLALLAALAKAALDKLKEGANWLKKKGEKAAEKGKEGVKKGKEKGKEGAEKGKEKTEEGVDAGKETANAGEEKVEAASE